jgi:dipeptidyl-peptidase 4
MRDTTTCTCRSIARRLPVALGTTIALFAATCLGRDESDRKTREPVPGVASRAAAPHRDVAAATPPLANPAFLEQYALTYRFTHGRPTSIRVTDDGQAVLFLRSGPRSFVRDLYEFDTRTGEERVLATAEQILGGAAEQLTPEELARRERMRSAARGIAGFDISDDGRQVLVPLSGQLYVIDRASGKTRKLASEGAFPIDPRFTPDGRGVSCVRDGEVYLIDLASGQQRKLTSGATETLTHGLAEFVAQEEMDRMHGYWWSPDGRTIAYQETDTADVEVWHIADPAQPAQPGEAQRYPRPGKNNARVRLGLMPAEGGQTTWIQWDAAKYPYLAAVTWQKNSPLTILVLNRRQTDALLLAVDPATGVTTALLHEHDDAWVNLDHGLPRWLDDGQAFLWSSERNGRWQLELHAADGKLLHELTRGELGYRNLAGLDEKQGAAFVIAGDDPTQAHLFRVPLDPKKGQPEQLTQAAGVHAAVFARRGGTHVRTASTAAGTIQQTVHGADGKEIGKLTSVAETPPFEPNVEWTTAGDSPEMQAAVIRPRDFHRATKYPVVVSVYGGPHSQTVTTARRRYLLDQWLADRGFIVVSIDGRGTPSRGRAWERAIRGNLIELPLADQVRGLQALGAKYPEMDLRRVGVYGWSFGGYFSAMAVMQRPDVFHAAVAGAPVADWLDYDTCYTERYLGLPEDNPKGYEASSVLTYAKLLHRPLLIIHGTTDDNVYFLHSIKMSNALFRAGKEHEFLPLAGFTHMVTDPLITRRLYTRIADYFVERLQDRSSEAGDRKERPSVGMP